MAISLRVTTMYNASAAAAGTSFPTDYRFGEMQVRTIFVTLNTADTVAIQASPDGTTWYDVATTEASATSAVLTLTGPYPFLRVNKTGTAGVATVVGVI